MTGARGTVCTEWTRLLAKRPPELRLRVKERWVSRKCAPGEGFVEEMQKGCGGLKE